MAKRAKATPKILPATMSPLGVTQEQIAWVRSFGLTGTDEALESLEARDEIVIVDKKDKPPVPFTREEIEREGETFARLVNMWVAAGIAVIVDKIGDQLVRQDPVCQRCKRTIPWDANYCPYCAHPVNMNG
ncbi:MAG: hypothetical protein WCE46_02485 [Methanoregula sp.]|uniref:hypothetical protein n=1 Tax=Methanoregula sp. TaxID=2052170 RepID=UPI003C758DE3